jgi:cell wall-associated NlpC family hydrolase
MAIVKSLYSIKKHKEDQLGLYIKHTSKSIKRFTIILIAFFVFFSAFGINSVLAVSSVSAPKRTNYKQQSSDEIKDLRLDKHKKKKQEAMQAAISKSTSAANNHTDDYKSHKYRYEKFTVNSVSGVKVFDDVGWLATLTNNSRTVVLRGELRTFSEPTTTKATVRHNNWVRLASKHFNGKVDITEVERLYKNATPDILQTAFEYTHGSMKKTDTKNVTYAGDASYGPLRSNGTREEGSDFNDYMGISWTYGSEVDKPESRQIGSLDCSGFVRMVWGYRAGYPLRLNYELRQPSLPRRAVQMHASTAGAVINNSESIIPGDLLFNDASNNDGTDIDHVSIYLGIDSEGNKRFISSRKTADGPTMGDVGGRSVINGSGLYAKSYRSALRL